MTAYARIGYTLATALFALGFTQPTLGAQEKVLGDLSGSWQLFVDDYLIATRQNAERAYHTFTKHPENPVMIAERPWEDNVVTAGVVLPNEDGSGYRMWHYCWTPRTDKKHSRAMYSTSPDGIHWERPNLGLVPWIDGSLDNNFLPHSERPFHTPFNKDPKKLYTSMSGSKHGYVVRYSEDGIHFAEDPDASPLTGGGDVGMFHYDPNTKQYLGYVKVNHDISGLRRRCVGFSSSPNLSSWPKLELVMAPDDFDDRWVEPGTVQRTHFYGCRVFNYQTMYLGLLWIFRAYDERGYFHGPVFIELVTSRDGVHWLRQEGERPPILPNGPAGSWDQGMLYTSPPLLEGNTIKLYYTGSPDYHDVFPIHGGVGLATLRKDGFASLDAGYDVAKVMTKKLKNARGPLHVNFDAGPEKIGGYIAVEVLDADGRVIPGYSKKDCDQLQGNQIDQLVTWGEHKELPTVGPIRLHFLIKNASLYSFMAGEDIEVIEDPVTEPTLAALYTFEKDRGKAATDVLDADGRQKVIFHGVAKVDTDAANVSKGEHSIHLGSPFRPLNRMEIDGTAKLGTHFTLAAMVKSEDNKYARLFSAYSGGGPVTCSELVFDFDPTGKFISGLRLACKGISVESEPVTFDDKAYHHLAVTFDDGDVRFYLDGKMVSRTRLPGGAPVELERNLIIGEDAELGTHEQLTGYLDDILVLGQALSAEEIATLSEKGAATLFELP